MRLEPNICEGADIEHGLDCYDWEGRVFPDIHRRIDCGQELTKLDVLLILRWKLGRVKDSNAITVSDNNLSAINAAVSAAKDAKCGEESLLSLIGIPGIGLPVATAILTACHPSEFTVLDWRVLESLRLFPSRMPKDQRREYKSEDWTAKEYIAEFLPRVKKISADWRLSLRDTDRALWGMSLRRRLDDVISKS